MEYLNCQLSEPKTWEDVAPASSTDFWNYQKIQCELPYQTTITNTTDTFYLFRTMNYGDLVIIFFLICFSFFLIFKFTWYFFIAQYVRHRRKP